MERMRRGSVRGEGGKKGEGQADDNMRVRASLSEEGGGRREEKSQWKSMREQANVNSFTF